VSGGDLVGPIARRIGGLLLVGALLMPASLHAQRVHLDVAAGASLSTFRGDWLDLDYRTGLAVSGTVGVDVSPHLRVESGLAWVQMGAEGQVQGFEEALFADHRLAYLRVPLHARVFLPVGERVSSTLQAGPAVSFEVSCEIGVEQTSLFLAVTQCPPNTGRSEIEWAVQAGGGLRYALERFSLLLDVTWHHGLTGLQDPIQDLELRNRAFTVSTGLSVPIG
jgi:hypothetical protein